MGTSGLKSASALLAAGRTSLHGAILITDKTNDASLAIYDNTAASGTVIFKIQCPGTSDSMAVMLPKELQANTGIYAAVTGTGANYIVYHE